MPSQALKPVNIHVHGEPLVFRQPPSGQSSKHEYFGMNVGTLEIHYTTLCVASFAQGNNKHPNPIKRLYMYFILQKSKE